jgi:hypothetical protein
VNRIYRPNTWQHRPSLRREDSSCQPGAVHTWHTAGIDKPALALISDKYRSRSIQVFRAIADFGIHPKDMSMDYVFGMFLTSRISSASSSSKWPIRSRRSGISQRFTAPAKMLISSTFSSKPRGVYWVVPGSSGTFAVSPKSLSNFQKAPEDSRSAGHEPAPTRVVIKRWQAARGYPSTGFLNKLQHKALLTEIVVTVEPSITRQPHNLMLRACQGSSRAARRRATFSLN